MQKWPHNIGFPLKHFSLTPRFNDYMESIQIFHGLIKTFDYTCHSYLESWIVWQTYFISTPCVFIDYAPNYDGYCCPVHASGWVITSRHMVFHADHFPFCKFEPTSLSSLSDNATPSIAYLILTYHHISNPQTLTPETDPPYKPAFPNPIPLITETFPTTTTLLCP